MTASYVIAAMVALLAALAIGVPVARAAGRDRRDTLRMQLERDLHERDVAIAELQGQLTALKDTIEAFARAFVDRRSHP